MSYELWLQKLAPGWLQGPVGGALLARIGMLLDEQRALMVAAVKARFPDATPEDGVALVGADRQLEQGPAELEPDFIERIKAAWDTWIAAGSHYPLHLALELAGFTAIKYVVQRNGRESLHNPVNDYANFYARPPWTFDTSPPAFYNQMGLVFPGALPAVTWSQGAGFSAAAARLNRVAHRWKPAKAKFFGTWILDGSAAWGWDSLRTWGDGQTWGAGTVRHIPPA